MASAGRVDLSRGDVDLHDVGRQRMHRDRGTVRWQGKELQWIRFLRIAQDAIGRLAFPASRTHKTHAQETSERDDAGEGKGSHQPMPNGV